MIALGNPDDSGLAFILALDCDPVIPNHATMT